MLDGEDETVFLPVSAPSASALDPVKHLFCRLLLLLLLL